MTATGGIVPVPAGRATARARLARLGTSGRGQPVPVAPPEPPPVSAPDPPHPPPPPDPPKSADPPIDLDKQFDPLLPVAADLPTNGTGIVAEVHRRRRLGDIAFRALRHSRRVAAHTVRKAWHDRILGLAAEAGFWQLLSLPPLLLSLLGAIGYLGDAVGHGVTARIEKSLLSGAGNLLTSDTVNSLVRPTVEEILGRGRPDVISIGFVISLWTGSTAMATFVNTITIAYGMRDRRSALKSRLLALKLYLAQIATGVVILPALIVGPSVLVRPLHGSVNHTARVIIEAIYWPAVALLSLLILTTLYHLSPPERPPWRRSLPGAAFALVLWLIGSYGLRVYLRVVFGGELVYGSLAAPVAVLLFLYITALAVLLGAELNASIELLHPGRRRRVTR